MKAHITVAATLKTHITVTDTLYATLPVTVPATLRVFDTVMVVTAVVTWLL